MFVEEKKKKKTKKLWYLGVGCDSVMVERECEQDVLTKQRCKNNNI